MDIDSLSPWWREQFEGEVKDGNFIDGDGTPLLVSHTVDPVANVFVWMNCLRLAGFKNTCVSVYEVINFMTQKDAVLSGVGTWQDFEEATTFFLYDLFTCPPLGGSETFTVYAFLQQAVTLGQCVILAYDGDTAKLDMHGEHIAQLIEQKFEAIDGNQSQEKNKPAPFLKKAKR
jgi:hypothetical protein